MPSLYILYFSFIHAALWVIQIYIFIYIRWLVILILAVSMIVNILGFVLVILTLEGKIDHYNNRLWKYQAVTKRIKSFASSQENNLGLIIEISVAIWRVCLFIEMVSLTFVATKIVDISSLLFPLWAPCVLLRNNWIKLCELIVMMKKIKFEDDKRPYIYT